MDPLSVLRDFNTSNKLQVVQQAGGNVQFGDRYSFPAATPVYKAAGAQAAAAYYSLQDVLFYLKHRHLKPQEYVMAAAQAGVGNINIVDRKKVLDVLDGTAAVDPAMVPVGGVPGAREAAGAEPQAKRQRVAEDEASAVRGLMERERQLRNRNSMLVAPNKDFRGVLEIVMNVKKQAHKQAATAAATAAAHKPAAPPSSSRQPPPRGGSGSAGHPDPRAGSSSGRYGRDSTADQLKAMAPGAGGALTVNMYGISSKGAPAAPPPPPPGGAGYVPVRKGGAVPPPPSAPPAASKPHHHSAKGAAPAAAAAAAGGKGKGGAEAKGGKPGGEAKKVEVKKGGVPIIIVPAGLTSMINMYNAKSFLEEGLFVPVAQAQAASGGVPKPSQLPIRRTAHRPAPVEYVLTDRPPAPSSPDWERVVAVVVQGAKWQFKDWPHKGAKDGDLAEALARVCGFYVHYADEKVGPPVSDWNVHAVPLHRESRHKDMTAMLGLYRHIDSFLQAKRSTLTY